MVITGLDFKKKSLKSENHPFHANFFKTKMVIKELQVMFVSKPSKNHRVIKEPYGYLDGHLTFSPPKKLRIVVRAY
jgi:hypothetical protein